MAKRKAEHQFRYTDLSKVDQKNPKADITKRWIELCADENEAIFKAQRYLRKIGSNGWDSVVVEGPHLNRGVSLGFYR